MRFIQKFRSNLVPSSDEDITTAAMLSGFDIGGYTAAGPHEPNEDSFWFATRTVLMDAHLSRLTVVVLADGMGGYAPGSGLISGHIVSLVGERVYTELAAALPDQLGDERVRDVIHRAIAATNEVVMTAAQGGQTGSTLVVAAIVGCTVFIANIGDSRVYKSTAHSGIEVITSDQSLVAEQVRDGSLTESDAYSAPGSNIILHAIGQASADQHADWYGLTLEPDSLLIFCTDGFWKAMRGEIPLGALMASDLLANNAERLVRQALEHGSDDNTTVVLVRTS